MYSKTIVSFFDGSCGPINPGGIIGVGVVSFLTENFEILKKCGSPLRTKYSSSKRVHEFSKVFRDGFQSRLTTSNTSEHLALNYAMKVCLLFPEIKNFVFFGDSMLVIRQMNRDWRMNSSKLYYPFAEENIQLDVKLSSNGKKLSYYWIPREFNIADELSR